MMRMAAILLALLIAGCSTAPPPVQPRPQCPIGESISDYEAKLSRFPTQRREFRDPEDIRLFVTLYNGSPGPQLRVAPDAVVVFRRTDNPHAAILISFRRGQCVTDAAGMPSVKFRHWYSRIFGTAA